MTNRSRIERLGNLVVGCAIAAMPAISAISWSQHPRIAYVSMLGLVGMLCVAYMLASRKYEAAHNQDRYPNNAGFPALVPNRSHNRYDKTNEQHAKANLFHGHGHLLSKYHRRLYTWFKRVSTRNEENQHRRLVS